MKIAGVDYDINWRAFTKGRSLSFPCLDYRQTWLELRPHLKRMGLEVVHKGYIDRETGVRGLRIWRM